jgi:hypothetical protein
MSLSSKPLDIHWRDSDMKLTYTFPQRDISFVSQIPTDREIFAFSKIITCALCAGRRLWLVPMFPHRGRCRLSYVFRASFYSLRPFTVWGWPSVPRFGFIRLNHWVFAARSIFASSVLLLDVLFYLPLSHLCRHALDEFIIFAFPSMLRETCFLRTSWGFSVSLSPAPVQRLWTLSLRKLGLQSAILILRLSLCLVQFSIYSTVKELLKVSWW